MNVKSKKKKNINDSFNFTAPRNKSIINILTEN